MHFLISPAKTLDFETPSRRIGATLPQFIPQSTELVQLLKTKSPDDIAGMMDISAALAALNVERYGAWSPKFTARNSKPAVLAFNGDVYEGLDAPTLADADLDWAQSHVSILSGLYGVLRPLDRIQPYRLEMGTTLANPHGRNLYAFWGDTLAEHLNKKIASDKVPVIVNLASQEYFKAADRKILKPRVIDCVFEDWKSGTFKVISFFAKRARGMMLRHAITRRCATPKDLEGFRSDGYQFDPSVSEPDRLVFRRRLQAVSGADPHGKIAA